MLCQAARNQITLEGFRFHSRFLCDLSKDSILEGKPVAVFWMLTQTAGFWRGRWVAPNQLKNGRTQSKDGVQMGCTLNCYEGVPEQYSAYFLLVEILLLIFLKYKNNLLQEKVVLEPRPKANQNK